MSSKLGILERMRRVLYRICHTIIPSNLEENRIGAMILEIPFSGRCLSALLLQISLSSSCGSTIKVLSVNRPFNSLSLPCNYDESMER